MARYLLSARNRVVWKRVMQMKMKKRIALLLAAAMLSLILCGCADDAETVGAVRSDGSVSDALATGLGVTVPEDETGRFASADGIHADVDYADMTWYIYDAAELLDKAARLGETADGKEAADLYDWLMAEYAKVYTFDNLAYIDFYAHPGDETLSDACRQLDSVLNEVNDALCTALSAALDGPAGSALRSYIGEDKATALVGYDEQTDRQREITERVSELTLLSKSLLPLPEKFHGLTDTEMRYRQRYVDLIANPEVKDTFVKRSQILKEIRAYLDEKGFLEVDTPILTPFEIGASARPFYTHHNSLNMDMVLRIETELYLKRNKIGTNDGRDRKKAARPFFVFFGK